MWFDYPLHVIDETGKLGDISVDVFNSKGSNYSRNFSNKRTPEQVREDKQKSFDIAFETLTSFDEKTEVAIKEIAEFIGKSEDTVRRYAKDNKKYYIDNGLIGKKQK